MINDHPESIVLGEFAAFTLSPPIHEVFGGSLHGVVPFASVVDKAVIYSGRNSK